MQNPRRKACATSRSAALPEGRSGADPVPPGPLRLIKEGIRFRNQLFQVFMAGFLGDSETCREGDFFACGKFPRCLRRNGFFEGERGASFLQVGRKATCGIVRGDFGQRQGGRLAIGNARSLPGGPGRREEFSAHVFTAAENYSMVIDTIREPRKIHRPWCNISFWQKYLLCLMDCIDWIEWAKTQHHGMKLCQMHHFLLFFGQRWRQFYTSVSEILHYCRIDPRNREDPVVLMRDGIIEG